MTEDDERLTWTAEHAVWTGSSSAQSFHDLARLAALAFDVPMAMVALRESGVDRIEAGVGIEDAHTAPAVLRLSAALDSSSDEILVVADTLDDPRTAVDPIVTGVPGVRFYLQAPIRAATGDAVGTIYLLGRHPFSPDARAFAQLRVIRNRVAEEIARLDERLTRPDTTDVLAQERRALQETAAAYRMLIEQSGDALFVVDARSMRIVETNASATGLFGYTRDEILQLRTSDLILPDDMPILLGAIADIEAGKRVIATRRLRRKDGSLFWGEVITSKLADGRRQSIVRNVAERIRLEDERAALMERVTDAFISLDFDGRVTWINEKAASRAGRRPDEMLGLHLFPDFSDSFSDTLRLACQQVQHEQVPKSIEVYFRPLQRWYEARIYPSATGISIFSSDVTERKQAEAALNLSEARFRVLVEQGADVIFMLDRAGDIIWCSPSVTKVIGYDPAELLGRPAISLVHPDDRPRSIDLVTAAMRDPGLTTSDEFRVLHRDGSLRVIEGFGVNRFDDPSFGAFVGSWHDITEQRDAEQVLTESADQLRRLTQRLQIVREEEQALLSRDLHDRLGQALTMLKLGLARVTDSVISGDIGAATDLRQLSSDVDALVQTTRQISADLRPPLLDDFGLAAALEWAAQRFAARTGLACTAETNDVDLRPEISRAFYAITQEALTNVARHAEATAVTIRLAYVNAHVQLDVEDDGVGISPTTLHFGDTLGLLGMRERATSVGARLEIVPGAECGTVVSIRIPRETVA